MKTKKFCSWHLTSTEADGNLKESKASNTACIDKNTRRASMEDFIGDVELSEDHLPPLDDDSEDF